ncbi:hypothetical protein [Aestuariibacter sp. A3R04]|uniref:hypothetical protein n=1 Tax=Aestuariibacter sp. A3R04 TaxID=2841571 RepID=UPI001C09F1E5|nr:hypothetical protein [Aestuariibacter sp. A3R04]MBU3023874.1 hypothetical protein [Aestuariibacter sp. A3R04]
MQVRNVIVVVKKLVCFFSLLLCCCAHSKTYVVASQNFNYFPHYHFSSNEDKGFIWALLETYTKYSGDKFIYVSLPVKRLQTELVKGTVDIIYPDNPIFRPAYLEPKNKYYSHTIVETISCVAVKPTFDFSSKNDIHRLSLPAGFATMDWGGLITQGAIKLIEVTSSLQALQYVDRGKADGTEIDYFVMRHLSKSSPSIDRFAVGVHLPKKMTEFKIATIKHRDLVSKIEAFMNANPTLIENLKIQYGIGNARSTLSTLSAPIPEQI